MTPKAYLAGAERPLVQGWKQRINAQVVTSGRNARSVDQAIRRSGETRTLPKTRGRHPQPKLMATALVRDEQDVVGSRSSAGGGPHKSTPGGRSGAEQAPGDPRSPGSAHTATPRVNEYDHPSLAASDSLRTYLLPQASRCREREAGWPLSERPRGNSRTARPPGPACSQAADVYAP